MFKIINRYILKEIGYPFIMTLFVFTFVLLIGKILQIMELMINKGISFFDISKLILFILPSFLTFTIPISFLIAILIGLGRLSSDSEITVLRASGFSLYQIMYPIAMASVIVCIVTAVIGVFAPFSNQATKNLLFYIVKQKASIGIREKVFNDDFNGLVLYADSIPPHGDYMDGVLISDKRLTNEPATILAKRGYLVSNPQSMTVTLRLIDGSIHGVDAGFQKYKKTDFSSYDVNLDLKSTVTGGENKVKKGSIDMTIGELAANIKRQDFKPEEVRDMIIELHKKASIPLSCLVFAILAIPFGIVSKRSGKSRGLHCWPIDRGRLLYPANGGGSSRRNREDLAGDCRVGSQHSPGTGRDFPFHRGRPGKTDPPSQNPRPDQCHFEKAVPKGVEKKAMKILDRYIIREFFKLFSLTMLTFTLLYLVVDFFSRIRMFLSNNATTYQIATHFGFGIPQIISHTMPVSVLLASLLTFSLLSKNSEIVALKSSGISLYRASLPLLVSALLISAFSFVFNEVITPYANQKAKYIEFVEVKKLQKMGAFKQNQIWYRSKNAIYNFALFDPQTNTLKGITINYIGQNFELTMRIDAKEARWQDGQWIFSDLLITTFSTDHFPVLEKVTSRAILLPETPTELRASAKRYRRDGILGIEKLHTQTTGRRI